MYTAHGIYLLALVHLADTGASGDDKRLMAAICYVESGGNPRAVNPADPSLGLCQIRTWVGTHHDARYLREWASPRTSLRVGYAVLRTCQKAFSNDVRRVIMCYNRGPNGTRAFVRGGGIVENNVYVRRVCARYGGC